MERNPNYAVYKKMASDISAIAKNYFIAIRRQNFIQEPELKENKEEEDDFQRHIRRVKNAYNQLDELEKAFINNDFFYQSYPDWWKETFSKTSYYRLRRQSMSRFIKAFENEE